MMKIIGHRGAAGLALENTLAGIEIARLLGVDAIELDVRQTRDSVLVLCHDGDLRRVSQSSKKLSELSFKQLQSIVLSDGESRVPSLQDGLRAAGDTPVILELKEPGLAERLHDVLAEFSRTTVTIVSFNLQELRKLREANPHAHLYGLEHTKPLDIIHWARIIKLNGVGLNFWLLNPLTYYLLRRHQLETYVYTVNNRLFARFLQLFYPEAAICTDHPEYFIKHSWTQLRKIRGQRERRASKQQPKKP